MDPAEIFINVNLNVNLTGNLKLYTNLCFVNNFLLAMLYKKLLITSLVKLKKFCRLYNIYCIMY